MSATTALDSQDLRGRLRRRLRWTSIAAIVAALLAAISAVVLVAVDAHLSAEQNRFDHHTGVIDEVVFEDGDDEGGWAMVTFEQGARTRHETVELDDAASFIEGPATVLVDPDDPDFVTLAGENYFPAGEALAYLLIGGFAACALAFATAAFVTHRNYRVLASSTWRTRSGFVTNAKSGDSKRWVLYLPDHDNGTFWICKRQLAMPRFTGSVAIDEQGRLVHRVLDGKRLAFAKRADTTSSWTKHRVSSASILGTNLDVDYTTLDQARRCTINFASGAQMPQLRAGDSIELLGGPFGIVAVRVPAVGVIGLSVPRKPRRRFTKTRARTAPEAAS